MDDRQWATFVAQAGIQADRNSKTFTPTWTGFADAPDGDLSYLDFGKIVYLSWDGAVELVETSNTNAMTITNLPSEIWPSQHRWLKCLVVNNDFTTEGSVSISTAGVLTFYFHQETEIITGINGLAPFATGFNTTNNKGVPVGWIIAFVR